MAREYRTDRQRPAPNPFLVNQSYDDFEEFVADARGWQVETALLDRGGFQADLVQYVDPDGGFYVVRTRMDARVRQVGEPPRGKRTFCIPADADLQMDWRRQQVGGSNVMVFPAGGELDAAIRPGFDMFIVSVEEEAFARAIEVVHGATPASFMDEVHHGDPAVIGLLRRRLVDFTRQFAARPCYRQITAELDDILIDVAHTLSPHSPRRRVAGRMRRRAATRRVIEYLDHHAAEVPTISRLCRIAGVSDRTLEIGFKEIFGIGPKAYVNAIRLNGLRGRLRSADSATTLIADAANEWGFWHMGQLAADYRRMFGELPSETLSAPGA